MSSLRKSSRVRPKSPPLQAPSVTPSNISISADDGIENRRAVRIGTYVSGILTMSVCSAPTSTTAGRGGPLFRSAAAAGFFHLTFDADNRKDQDLAHDLFGRRLLG